MRSKLPAALLTAALVFAGAAPAGAGTYANPVLVDTHEIRRPSPAPYVGTLGIGDPAVIVHGGRYYLYPTGDNFSYDVYVSEDLVRWEKGPKVFRSGTMGVWAPDVFFSERDGLFYLYYTVNGRIGVASSDRPDGEFADRGVLVEGGIDAHLFRDDDGSHYLYYARYPRFAVFVQPMESPVRAKGAPLELLAPTEGWERREVPVAEAPWVLKRGGVYYLLYSGGSADSEHYAIGYATATSPLGPFAKHPGNPIAGAGEGVFGPGHPSVVPDRDGRLWAVYHQQRDARRGWNRVICVDPLWFDADGVLHLRATRGAQQPAPVTASGRAPPSPASAAARGLPSCSP